MESVRLLTQRPTEIDAASTFKMSHYIQNLDGLQRRNKDYAILTVPVQYYYQLNLDNQAKCYPGLTLDTISIKLTVKNFLETQPNKFNTLSSELYCRDFRQTPMSVCNDVCPPTLPHHTLTSTFHWPDRQREGE